MALDLNCDWRAGFVMDPSKKQRVGYLTEFEGLKLDGFLKPDIEVFTPYGGGELAFKGVKFEKKDDGSKITCVGMIDNFSYGGGVGDPICISAYISSQNAEKLQGKLKTALDTNLVDKFSWWICNFDVENKEWFEEAYPKEPVSVVGQINAPGGKDYQLSVAQDATRITPTLDTNVYHLYFELIPAANSTYNFNFATSSKTKYVRNWGLKVGENASNASSKK